jgi:hypothetical protein
MATTGAGLSSTTIARLGHRRGPLVAGHLEVVEHLEAVEHLAVVVVGHLALEGHPAVAEPVVEGDPVVKGLSRPAGALKAQPHMEGSIVQMKRTRSGSARPIASALPLEFRAQPNLGIKAR